jgi:hypothetical protein
MVVVWCGDKGWKKVDNRETTDWPKPGGDEGFKYVGPRALLRLKDTGMKVSLLGERKAGDHTALLGDRTALCLQLARADGKEWLPAHLLLGQRVKEVRLYFDKESGLLLKEELNDPHHIEIFYSDYQVFNGIPVAQKLAQRTDGEVIYRSEVEFHPADRLDAKLFQKP